MRVITVVMGEPDSKVRNEETTQMLDYAFANYKINTILSTKTNLGKKEIDKGVDKYVNLVPKENVNILSKKTDKDKKINYEVEVGELKAPVKKGDKVGEIKINENGKTRIIDVTVEKDVKKVNIFSLYIRYLKDVITGDISI